MKSLRRFTNNWAFLLTASAIKREAAEINKLIFSPALSTPIKTLDLPLGGKNEATNSLSMIYELVELFRSDKEVDDESGVETLALLKAIKKVLIRVNDIHPSSLGLHPAVYIYSNKGNFRVIPIPYKAAQNRASRIKS